MADSKLAWDITQSLYNLLYNTEKSDNEIFEISKIFAETFFIALKNFAESAPAAEGRKLRKSKTKSSFRIFLIKCCKYVKTIFLNTSY